MGISNYLKIIGRGSKGSGDLDRAQAKEVFTKILSGEVSDLELGAFCIAMRIKGESVSELMGFMDALIPEIASLDIEGKPTIILPSYNGARKQANLTPLLAGMLSARGFLVIVQGVEQDPLRVTSLEIFKELGWPVLENANEFSKLLKQNLPIFCPLRVISPALQKLLDIREQIGLRNTGHVLAKLINPCSNKAWQVSNYTHPEYPEKLKQYFVERAANVILMRGNEGEPVASLSRLPEMHFLFSTQKEETSTEEKFTDSNLFSEMNARATAVSTAQTLSGNIVPPKSIEQQVSMIAKVMDRF